MTKIDQKWPKSPKIWFQWAHMMKLIVNYVWNKFGKILELFDHFLAIFFFSLKTHDFSEFFFENSKKALFDLWDLLWWVFHMFLALNHWFRPNNEGWKKSVPKMFKTAVTVVLKNWIIIFLACSGPTSAELYKYWLPSLRPSNNQLLSV